MRKPHCAPRPDCARLDHPMSTDAPQRPPASRRAGKCFYQLTNAKRYTFASAACVEISVLQCPCRHPSGVRSSIFRFLLSILGLATLFICSCWSRCADLEANLTEVVGVQAHRLLGKAHLNAAGVWQVSAHDASLHVEGLATLGREPEHLDALPRLEGSLLSRRRLCLVDRPLLGSTLRARTRTRASLDPPCWRCRGLGPLRGRCLSEVLQPDVGQLRIRKPDFEAACVCQEPDHAA
mmetsp:Transcript_18238/g.64103  ORF Transcript_18238/g.64103 Transcript_18238/m.64103 type:complete len:237 (-) Transcript_18238:396-1106(-)